MSQHAATNYLFLLRDAMLARYMLILHVSVYPPVRKSSFKRLDVSNAISVSCIGVNYRH